MKSSPKSLILAIALGLAATGAAVAQDAEAPATAAEEEFDIGEPVNQVGQSYIREEFTDWALRCVRAPEGQPDPCELYQLLKDADGNDVAEFSIIPLQGGQQAAAGATIVAPLETLLTENLIVTVDGAEPRRYPFQFCNRAGCVAQFGLTHGQVDQLKRGARAEVRLVPAAAPDQEVRLEASLSGFTAGFAATTAPVAE